MKHIALLLMTISLFGCSNKKSEEKTGMERKTLPEFNLLLLDSITTINTNSIRPGSPIVLFYFNPGCPFCKEQTKEIVQDIKSLRNIQFYLISTKSISQLKEYAKYFELAKYSNITISQDYSSYFRNYFKTSKIPCLVIYNKQKMLKQILIGKVPIRDIIRYCS